MDSGLTEQIELVFEQIKDSLTHIDYSPLFGSIREIVRSSIEENFKVGGRYGDGLFGGGTKKWDKSKRALKQGGSVLQDSGQLAASIEIDIIQNADGIFIEIGSNKPYAAAHNFGSKHSVPVTDKSRSFFKAMYLKTNEPQWLAMAHSKKDKFEINLLERPYLVLQDEDIEEILDLILTFSLQHE